MADLYKYNCLECDIPTYVEWHAVADDQRPYCGNCGSDRYMKIVAEVDIFEETELED